MSGILEIIMDQPTFCSEIFLFFFNLTLKSELFTVKKKKERNHPRRKRKQKNSSSKEEQMDETSIFNNNSHGMTQI